MYLEQAKLLENIKIKKSILIHLISNMKENNPILVIQWNFNVFNGPNRSRNEDPSHTINKLIEYIQNSGGKDLFDLHTMFMFQTENDFYNCMHQLPAW